MSKPQTHGKPASMYDHLSHVPEHSIELGGPSGAAAKAVEYPGKLRVYDYFGGCGSHPQFGHLKHPPEGYFFVNSDSRPRRSGHFLTLYYAFKMFMKCLWRGVAFRHVYRFVRTRGLRWQRFMGGTRSDLLFFPSVPFHLDQFAWSMEIEDSTSMLFPFFYNGDTAHLRKEQLDEVVPIFRQMLESPNCKAVISHMKSTVDSLPTLVNSKSVAKKIFHIPVGVPVPDWRDVQRIKADPEKKGPIILFSNSWHQNPGGFFVRGGLDVLETFALVKAKLPSARLILRTSLSDKLSAHYRKMITDLGVEVIDKFLQPAEWHRLRASADYFIFPSARIHIVSLLEAMAYGMCVITSNGWGVEEYARDGHNAVIVSGRDKVAWMDHETGLLREDYTSLYQANLKMAGQLAEAFFRLEADPAMKARLVNQARKDVEETYTVERWNEGLKKVFDSVI